MSGTRAALIWIKSAPHILVLPGDMAEDYQPGDPAPETGDYEECNVFGSPTGTVAHVRKGEPLPGAPRGFTWRLSRPQEE